jgi:hypothetical protein
MLASPSNSSFPILCLPLHANEIYYCLFSYAESTFYQMIGGLVNKESERVWDKYVVTHFKILSRVFLEGLRKTTNIFRRDLKSGSSYYES